MSRINSPNDLRIPAVALLLSLGLANPAFAHAHLVSAIPAAKGMAMPPRGWFLMYHGVETRETVGVYRTFWALLDLGDPSRILRLEDEQSALEANPELTRPIARQMYLPTPVLFTTGVADAGEHYIVASGEVDLACRITHMPKALFA